MNKAFPDSFPANDGKIRFVLAPMEGVTDAPMRELMTRLAPWDWCVTEFLRVNDQCLADKVFLRKVPELETGGRTTSGTPVSVQLLGGNAELLALSAVRAVELGALGIDLNFGCPAPTVNRHDGGATLLKYPHRILEIVSAVRRAVPSHVPVSAKIRLGWENPADVVENAVQVWRGGADWLTIHARTRMAGYSPPVFWDWIGRAAEKISIPVVANGDIWNIDDIRLCRELTGCNAYMLGRGALALPSFVNEARAFLSRAEMLEGAPVAMPYASPITWVNWFRQLDAATGPHPRKQELLAGRCKQWGNMANRVRKLDWFDRIKKQTTLDAICSALSSEN